MEKEFAKQLDQDIAGSDFGSKQDDLQMWYNERGDYIQFKTMNVSAIRERIDECLTLYISLEDQKPIGFQLKDIKALADLLDVDIMIKADITSSDKSLVSITALILFKAYTQMPESADRRTGYGEAFKTLVKKDLETSAI